MGFDGYVWAVATPLLNRDSNRKPPNGALLSELPTAASGYF
jgi:hypothetical protein